jgi:hypothetical protein
VSILFAGKAALKLAKGLGRSKRNPFGQAASATRRPAFGPTPRTSGVPNTGKSIGGIPKGGTVNLRELPGDAMGSSGIVRQRRGYRAHTPNKRKSAFTSTRNSPTARVSTTSPIPNTPSGLGGKRTPRKPGVGGAGMPRTGGTTKSGLGGTGRHGGGKPFGGKQDRRTFTSKSGPAPGSLGSGGRRSAGSVPRTPSTTPKTEKTPKKFGRARTGLGYAGQGLGTAYVPGFVERRTSGRARNDLFGRYS